MNKTPLIFITSLLFSIQTFAWGWLGHSTVGMIAESQLSPQARNEIRKLLVKENLSSVANWADSLKSTTSYKQTVWYHFEKMPDHVQFLDHLKGLPEWQQKKGGVISAILVAEGVLRNPKAPTSEQVDALKFMVHFMGDLHQPLHTGRPEDNGGVKTKVVWFGSEMSLHKVWDSGMIGTGHDDLFKAKILTDEVTVTDAARIYADYLFQKFAKHPVSAEPNLGAWLNESLVLRLPSYELLNGIDQKAYQNQQLEVIDLQIYLAGIRLAQYLNEIYKGLPVASPNESLLSQIERIIGDIEQVISLRP